MITPEQIQAMKDRMKDRPPAGVGSSFIKNPDYDPNDSSVKRYIPSGEQVTEVIKPPEAPQVDETGAISTIGTAEGIKGAFGDKPVPKAVRLAGGQDVFTIGEKGKWIETPEEYEQLFGTREQAGIVGEITPEQAKLLGIRPEGVAELKATRQKDVDKKELFDLAQKAGLTWEEATNLVNTQYPIDTAGIRDELGISDVESKLFQMPDQTIQELYQSSYDQSELPNLKNKVKAIDDKIASRESDLVKATGELNMNPWISQATRTGRLRILNELALADINNLNKQRNSYIDLYDKGIDELEGVVLRSQDQYDRQKTMQAEQFNYLLGEAERREAEAMETRKSEHLRYMPDYLKEMAAETGDVNTDMIELEDGTQILINTDTGAIIQSYGGENDVGAGIVGGYNISRYATDPNHEASVNAILQKIGKFDTWEAMDKYIQQVAPGSPVTGEMIGKASEKFGVDWEMMVAMMQQDSSLGTAGKGARTFNPGNVGNDDTGREVNFGNWQAGVDAVAKWLGKNKVAAGADGTYAETSVFNYNEKLDINKIPKLGGKQITNKTARGSNLPYGITDKQADWVIEHRLGNIQFQQLKSKDVKSLNDLVELREDINTIRELKKQVNTGPIRARVGRAERYAGWETSAFNQLEVKSGKQLADFIKEISGAAVSEQEAQRLKKLVPNIEMQDKHFNDALDDLEDGLSGLISAKIIQFDLENEETLIRAIRGEVIENQGQVSSGKTSSGMSYTVE